MLKILNKISGIHNVIESNNLLEKELDKNNTLKIFNQLKKPKKSHGKN